MIRYEDIDLEDQGGNLTALKRAPKSHKIVKFKMICALTTAYENLYTVGRPLSRNVVFFRKIQLPIGLHSNCSISPTAGGTCQKGAKQLKNAIELL